MTSAPPLVSICLPVYNGQQYVRETIQSILAQTFEDFELIIADNASTDATGDICREIAARDSRVRYHRSEVNGGLAWNFNRAFALARGRYVAWIGHDDLMGSEYIARCVDALESDPGAVLCYAHFHYIDGQGTVFQTCDTNAGALDRTSLRFNRILWDGMCDPIFGLMRVDVLKQTKLHGGFADSDRVLLAEMGLRGRFAMVPACLFSRRLHGQQTTTKYKDLRERTLVFDPTKAGRLFFPVLLEVAALLSAIRRASLPYLVALRCQRWLLWWVWVRRRWLWADLREGASATVCRYLSEEQRRRLKPIKYRMLQVWHVWRRPIAAPEA